MLETTRAALVRMQTLSDLAALATTGLAELDALAIPPPSSSTITIKKGDAAQFQKAINFAPPGTTIRAYPDAYDGVALPNGPHFVTIRPDTAEFDTPTPKRVTPEASAGMIRLRANAGPVGQCIVTSGPAVGFNFVGVELLPGTRPDLGLAVIGGDRVGDPALQPHLITFDRCLSIPDPMVGYRHGIQLYSRAASVWRSHFDNFFHTDDAQPISGLNGPGPYDIDDNFLCGSGENFILGGGTDVSPWMRPAYLTFRRNFCTKRPEWQGQKGRTAKNTFELKSCLCAIVEGNVFEFTWPGGGQIGYLIVITPRNQDNKSPFVQVTNVAFRWNVVRHGAGGFNITGFDDEHASLQTINVAITDNLVHGLSSKWGSGNGRAFSLSHSPLDVEIARNTIAAASNSFLTFDGPPIARLGVHDNVFPEGAYGIKGSGTVEGAPSWDAFTTASAFDNNLIQRGTSGRKIVYPGTGNVLTAAGIPAIGPDFKLLAQYARAGLGVDVDELARRVGVPLA
jgi:hypothetical protein